MNLGKRELQILHALWAAEGEASVAEVLERIQAEGSQVAYTTVQTLLNRMVDKGVAGREKRGRAFVYVPKVPFEAVSCDGVGETIDLFFAGSAKALAVHLIENELDASELEALRDLIESHRRRDP